MKKGLGVFLVLALLVALFGACQQQESVNAEAASEEASSEEAASEELYILVSALSTYDMFKSNDFAAFEQWGKDFGVQTQIIGPADWDMAAQAAAIDQAAAQRPAGLLVGGFDNTLKGAIDNAVDSGIPVVTYDADVPESKRLAFSGTDWAKIGEAQGYALGDAIGGEGKVAYMGVVGMGIMEAAFAAFEKVMTESYPDVELIGKFNADQGIEQATQIATDLITANPDIAGFAAFNSFSGPGIGIAIREADRVGDIKLTSVDMEPQQLQLVKDGIATMLVGQKRKLFTYYGAMMLYDYVHHESRFSKDDRAAEISTIPARVDTGLIIITQDNLHYFIDG